jgi:hypothetical protein
LTRSSRFSSSNNAFHALVSRICLLASWLDMMVRAGAGARRNRGAETQSCAVRGRHVLIPSLLRKKTCPSRRTTGSHERALEITP